MGTGDFRIRPYAPGDEHAILTLFNRVLTEDDPAFVPRTMATWRHRYTGNPMGHQVLVAVDDAGTIVGNYSAMAMHCSVRGEKLRCAQAVDTVVDRAFRRSLRKTGMFVSLGRAYLDTFCRHGVAGDNQYAYGLPNNQAFGAGTRLLGYQPVHCPMPTLVKEFDEAWIDALAGRAGGVSVTQDDWSALPEVARLFESTLDEVPLGLWRDETYLAWRYRDWPDVRYHLALARRGPTLVGATVFSLGWLGHPIVPLMDWIGPGADEAALAALLAGVARTTWQAGGRRLETWVTPNMPQHASLLRLGFLPQPSPFNLCIMVYSDRFDLDWSRSHWFFTMGDSDIY